MNLKDINYLDYGTNEKLTDDKKIKTLKRYDCSFTRMGSKH